ncbi:S8 family peptidase [Bradyrhizobium glycinis]|uniref:S8 family peptidase n=1 Tax=Bradyrhizobium glycinis TaxID=2751812 RepID=UPI0018D9AF98|nr:S8 family serine peptidase [Bradyrhizobium glycinis]MBH5370967.1 S8 family serine peptidase [Bradyrhizobium glycinis]
MLRRYAIIEAPKRLRSGAASPSGTTKAGYPNIRIRAADLSKRDVLDIEKDPSVEDFGLIMPTRLIRPVRKQQVDVTAALPAAWGIVAVGADRVDLDGSGVAVAVLDTGIDRTHAAFAGLDIEEEDFGGSGNGDKNGHGTHCAGTIFGKDVGQVRIGIARNIRKALIAKVFPDGESGDSLSIFRALEWAANKGANIVSMSLGFDFPGMVSELEKDGYPTELATSIGLEHFKDNLRMFDSMMRVIEAGRAFGRGPLVIAASGNESQRNRDPRFRISASLPSAATGVISVAAVRNAGGSLEISDFSNGRAKICAPGEEILSAAPNGGFATMSGTSMACPHIAGLAALWWQKVASSAVRPNAETVAQRLVTSAVTAPLAHFDPDDSEVGFAVAPG